MADEKEKQDPQPESQTKKEIRRNPENIKKSNWAYYERNKHWILEHRANIRAAKREERAKERRKRGPYGPRLSPEERAKRDARRAKDKIRDRKWKELGWIVAKMNIQAKLSQGQIYELLGGLATASEIREWCQRGKKLGNLDPSQK